jgi:hypothetical protein
VTAIVVQGDARRLPLPDASVDLICTSPPYLSLRSYQDQGEHYAGQVGSEATPAAFVDALIECTREMVRVLKPSGSMFINLGDKYAGSANEKPHTGTAGIARPGQTRNVTPGRPAPLTTIRTKSLIGIPWRYAIRCIDDLGLILRAEIIWCLSGGARVYARTPTGDRPVMLRDLVRAYRPENIQLWNGRQWTRVCGWNRTPDDSDALEIELRTGERIGCTPGHQWPTAHGLVRANEICVGDVIETTRLPQRADALDPEGLPYDDIGWLVGLYIAEGSRSQTTIQFAGHIKEDARHARLARIAAAYDATFAVYQTSENGVTANIHGSVIGGILDRYVSAGTAHTKRLRLAAWQRTDSFLAAVVEGYLDGDGHYEAKNDRWQISFTANDEWAADMRTLAARLGVRARLRRCPTGWRGEWRWSHSSHWNVKEDGEVVAIRRSRARDFYDIGVTDDPHTFALASGVLTHNSKPNGLPESVTDRVRRSHEQWFHMVKQPRYFSAIDEVREGYALGTSARYQAGYNSANEAYAKGGPTKNGPLRHDNGGPSGTNPLGKLPGSVWSIPSQPLSVPAHLGVDHFAAFPCEWPRRLILGWSPGGICVECGDGRRPATEGTPMVVKPSVRRMAALETGNASRTTTSGTMVRPPMRTITGYACACPEPSAPARPAVVLDPFGGTGTTSLVASALGRIGVSIDLSHDYGRLAQWRVADPNERAKALHVDKPPPVLAGQLGMFE